MSATLALPFQLGSSQSHGGVTITPLFPLHDPVCDYVSLDDALLAGLEIGEVSAAGVVGQLAVANPLEKGVLLYDGEELAGAKQNRILNVSVLVAAGTKTVIPVSCVEAGRWSSRSHRFRSAGHVAGPDMRRRKATSLRVNPQATQGEVWSAVDDRMASRGLRSNTRAYSDGVAQRRDEIADRSRSFSLEPGQCGMIAAVAGQGWCLDAVSRPDAFARVYPKLMAGYLFDAFAPVGEITPPDAVLELLARCAVTHAPSVARGSDIRLEGGGVIASGLVVDDELVQLSAYSGA